MKLKDDFERQIAALNLDEATTSKLIIAYRAKCCSEGEEWPLDRAEHAELLEHGVIIRPTEMFRKAIEVAAKAWWYAGTKRTSRPISIGEITEDGIEIKLDSYKLQYLESRAKLLNQDEEPTKPTDILKVIKEAAKAAKEDGKPKYRNLEDLEDWDDEEPELLTDDDVDELIKSRR